MEFIFGGTGTSQGIPVIACKCAVCQSDHPHDKRLRTSGILRSEQSCIVFDTGPDFRQQMLRENIDVLDAVVFTHEHKDHTAGMDDVRAYNYMLQRPMDIYGSTNVIRHLKREYYYIFEQKDYPGVPQLILHQIDEKPFQIGDIKLQPIPVMHGKMPVMGFRCGPFAYITDAKEIPESSMKKLEGVEILVLNALRRKSHHSHLTLEEAIEVAQQIGAGQSWFTHISHLMGRTEAVEKELPPGIRLAWDGLKINFE